MKTIAPPKSSSRLRASTAGLLLILLPLTMLSAPKQSKKPRPVDRDSLFTVAAVPVIKIEASEAAMKVLRKARWEPGPQPEREEVQVTVREGQNVYTNVALHLKGAAGSFRPVDDRPGITLNFSRFGGRQQFHGLTKLSLNNSVQDSTYISEQLCRELFLKAGIPVPRATHAFVELNGRPLGLYVLTEGWDRKFLRRHFKNTKGNLYDGGFLKDVGDSLAVNSGRDPEDQSDRTALAEAAKHTNLTQRIDRLEKILDTDRFLTFIALDIMLWDWDGYALNRNNWRLYHDLDTDRMVFMPHGMDQMFWKPTGSILPPMQGLIAKALLEAPEYRQRYFDRLKQLRTSVFVPEAMTNRAYAIAGRFILRFREVSPEKAKEQEKALADFCDAIVRRGQSIDEQLAHPIEPAVFDVSGYAQLTGWESKSDFGFPVLAKGSEDEAKQALRIGTKQGSSVGSWRTRVWLEKGRYRIIAKIRTEAIVADIGDKRGGAGVRTDRSRPEEYLLGDTDWKPLEYDFSVDDSLTQVQVICEFRGTQGQAWFDLDSLRLKKAP